MCHFIIGRKFIAQTLGQFIFFLNPSNQSFNFTKYMYNFQNHQGEKLGAQIKFLTFYMDLRQCNQLVLVWESKPVIEWIFKNKYKIKKKIAIDKLKRRAPRDSQQRLGSGDRSCHAKQFSTETHATEHSKFTDQ